MTVDLGAEHELEWLTWVPRENNVNGQVSDFTISFSTDGETWTEPVEKTLPAGTAPTNLELTDTARYVKIVITENHADDNQFATIGELEFRATSEEPVEVDPVVQVWAPPATCGPDTTVPEINAIADQAAPVGSAVSLQVEATDDRSSDLTYSATGLPAGVTIDPATGLISGTPTEAGTYPVTVTVTDGRFVRKDGWTFNNLTYLPYMTREAWGANPLANKGEWTATTDQRKWMTECDTEPVWRFALGQAQHKCRVAVLVPRMRHAQEPGSRSVTMTLTTGATSQTPRSGRGRGYASASPAPDPTQVPSCPTMPPDSAAPRHRTLRQQGPQWFCIEPQEQER